MSPFCHFCVQQKEETDFQDLADRLGGFVYVHDVSDPKSRSAKHPLYSHQGYPEIVYVPSEGHAPHRHIGKIPFGAEGIIRTMLSQK